MRLVSTHAKQRPNPSANQTRGMSGRVAQMPSFAATPAAAAKQGTPTDMSTDPVTQPCVIKSVMHAELIAAK